MEDFIGVVKVFAGSFAPRGWQLCNGQIIGIAQNSALFSILGTTYGGNGQTTFALPDLRGRVAVGWGQGPGLSNYTLGEVTGTESVSILTTNMPSHNHTATSTLNVNNTGTPAAIPSATTSIGLAKDINTDNVTMYATGAPNVALAPSSVTTTVGLTGGNQPISILQPVLALTYIICMEGYFPSRN
ncbi:phage tail protein [Pedobacter hiemivivus]|nr:tail fiber protein [Pedobacter hiemivivus]